MSVVRVGFGAKCRMQVAVRVRARLSKYLGYVPGVRTCTVHSKVKVQVRPQMRSDGGLLRARRGLPKEAIVGAAVILFFCIFR